MFLETKTNMEQYIHSLGLLLSNVKIDRKGRLFILVEGTEMDEDGSYFFREVEIPEQYQTLDNIEIIRKLVE